MNWADLSQTGSRETNEDSICVFSLHEQKVFIVADGLGGHGKGDLASNIALNAFRTVFEEIAEASLRDQLERAFIQAQADILEEQRKCGNSNQMKTTVCVLTVRENELIWGHIGDSRVYAFSHNRVKMRTLDHSVPQMLVMSKEIKEKDIRHHPDRNRLLRVLGVSGEDPKYELSEVHKLRKYQAFLLCTDGFWELIFEKEMGDLLKESHSAQEWLSKMQEIVERRGAGTDMDNYSAIAILV